MNKLLLLPVILVLVVSGTNASPQYDNLVKLVKSGASEDVIVAYVNASDSAYNLSSDEIVHLKEYGASQQVIIAAIQHKGNVPTNSNTQVAQAETPSVTPPPYVVYRPAYPARRWRAANYSRLEQRISNMNQALQLDVAQLMFGTASLNYELLLSHQHGIVVEGSYNAGWDSHGENAELAYRWHWARSMNSGFVGAFLRGSRFYGNEYDWSGQTSTTYAQTSITLGPDIGRRWVAPWGLSVVARVGYGYTWSTFDNPAPDQNTMDQLRWNMGWDSELSFGYAF